MLVLLSASLFCVQSPRCCLCVMRGGALKLTSDNKWAHVICAICLPDVTFENIAKRYPICVDYIDASRTKLVSYF